MSKLLKVGVFRSIRPDEKRVPIHPEDIEKLYGFKGQIYFEVGYGKDFALSDEHFQSKGFTCVERQKLLSMVDVALILKPTIADLDGLQNFATTIGWCHAVQDVLLTAKAKEKQLTLIAMENMYFEEGGVLHHVFHENNFQAGYLGVKQACHYVNYFFSNNFSVAVLGSGAVAQGAVAYLKEQSSGKITIFSRRKSDQLSRLFQECAMQASCFAGYSAGFSKTLLTYDIIINAIKQDVLNPVVFLKQADLRGICDKLIVDLSCDVGMGFEFERKTTHQKPVIQLDNNYFYAIDNIPSLEWRAVSKHLSFHLASILLTMLGLKIGDYQSVIVNAIEIHEGEVVNPLIEQYQSKLTVAAELV